METRLSMSVMQNLYAPCWFSLNMPKYIFFDINEHFQFIYIYIYIYMEITTEYIFILKRFDDCLSQLTYFTCCLSIIFTT